MPPGPGSVALQIPITYELNGQTLQVTTPENVLKTHRAGYAVHVWLSNDEENARVYDRLLNMCVDGIMAAKPKLLERRLRRRDVVRPGGHGTDPCSVRASRATAKKRAVAVVAGPARRRAAGLQGQGADHARAGSCSAARRSRSPRDTDAGGVSVPLTKAGKRLLKRARSGAREGRGDARAAPAASRS